MNIQRLVSAQRMVYFSIAVIILLGITFTGFTKVHWFLYIPIVFLTFAGATGFCPAYVFWSRILHK